jgi:hypothetical protein
MIIVLLLLAGNFYIFCFISLFHNAVMPPREDTNSLTVHNEGIFILMKWSFPMVLLTKCSVFRFLTFLI